VHPCYLRPFIFMAYFVYILQSESTGRFYIGQTEHLEERIQYHRSNYSKAIKNRGPWKLRRFEGFPSRGEGPSFSTASYPISLRLHSLLRRHDKRKVNFRSDYQVYVVGEGE
jgi:hypothetical protein